MTRQKIRKHAFEAPKVSGLARNSLMPRLGGLKVSDKKDMKDIQAIDAYRPLTAGSGNNDELRSFRSRSDCTD
jgi:hypothetical protein